jgi:hypothetical protein
MELWAGQAVAVGVWFARWGCSWLVADTVVGARDGLVLAEVDADDESHAVGLLAGALGVRQPPPRVLADGPAAYMDS